MFLITTLEKTAGAYKDKKKKNNVSLKPGKKDSICGQ